MVQLNITRNQEILLQLLLDDRNETFKNILQKSLDTILQAESFEQLKAASYAKLLNRTGSRNFSAEILS